MPRLTAAGSTRSQQRLVRISVRSAFRVALVFYLLIVAAWLAVGSVLFLILQSTGAVANIESFYGEVLGYQNVRFHFTQALLFFAVAGLVWVLFSSVATALFALLYNRASRLVGGVRLVVEDEEMRRKR